MPYETRVCRPATHRESISVHVLCSRSCTWGSWKNIIPSHHSYLLSSPVHIGNRITSEHSPSHHFRTNPFCITSERTSSHHFRTHPHCSFNGSFHSNSYSWEILWSTSHLGFIWEEGFGSEPAILGLFGGRDHSTSRWRRIIFRVLSSEGLSPACPHQTPKDHQIDLGRSG